jgi:hypothetical protein
MDNEVKTSFDDVNKMVIEFSKSTQNVCMGTSISMFLILLFIMTPLNNFMLSSIFGKVMIITVLGYTLYYNLSKTNTFYNKVNNDFNISFTSGNWNAVKTNILCSYIFSTLLIILLLSVIRKLF